MIGQVIGRFRVLAKLGEGGMGVVYRAADTALRRDVALKVLPEGLAADPERRALFLREARAAAAVSHPNLVTIFEVGESGPHVYLALDLVEGRPLREVMSEGRLEPRETLRVGRAIAAGMACAHAAGVVHRDLKPENVMLARTGDVKVLDFGIARLTERADPSEPTDISADTAPAVTLAGRVVGTPGYMAPEQARGRPVDARADVFALGVILYEACTGQRPFLGESASDALASLLRDEPPSLRSLAPDAPEELERIVQRCLSKDPDERFADCGELSAALEACEVGRAANQTRARGATSVERAARPRWRTLLAATLAAGAIAGVSVAVWRAATPSSPAAPEPSVSAPASARPFVARPTAGKPEAIAAYLDAMACWHDNKLCHRPLLERAVAIDPSLGEAHIALMILSVDLDPPAARREFAEAMKRRDALAPEDRGLLDSYEPVVARDPADWEERERRVVALAQAYPDSAWLAMHVAVTIGFRGDFERSLVGLERALEIDPTYANAHRSRGETLAYLGRVDEARAAFTRCLELSPSAGRCLDQAATLEAHEGRCDVVEAYARRMLVIGPDEPEGRRTLASVALARGMPVDSVREMLRQAWTRTAEARRAQTEAEDRTALAIAYGDFDGALVEADKLEAALAGSDDVQAQGALARARVDALLESGRAADAGAVAQSFLDRAAAWPPPPKVEDTTLAFDARALMIGALRRAGRIDANAFRARIKGEEQRWIGRLEGVNRSFLWPYVWAATAETPEEAADALQALQHLPPPPPYHFQPIAHADVGRTYWLAGRMAEALTDLRRGASSCLALPSPQRFIRAHLFLGFAEEAAGHTREACAAYGLVVARWGDAKPRSVTAEEAKKHMTALACTKGTSP